MPISNYNFAYGGKPGSAAKARNAMQSQYGAQKGKRVFYATANRNTGGLASRLSAARRKAGRA